MKVGLVLGAGGVLGGAWLTGGLEAIARHTGWDPGSADKIVGTSAGSMIGAFTAAGVPPWFMVAHSAGETFEGLTGPDGRPAADADRSGGAVFRLHRGLPRLGPGSLRMAATTLRRPLHHTPLQLVTGWLPAGVISTEHLEEVVGAGGPRRRLGRPPVVLGGGHRHHGRASAPSSVARAPPRPSCARPSPPRARSPASTGR